MYRLEPRPDEWIDRRSAFEFRFEGARHEAYAGDTITSALAAAGVAIVGRSFKYHRPRGLLSFANHDSNALFDVDGVPNVRGDVTAVRAGMSVTAVNTFGGLAHDRAHLLDAFSRWLPVGFYYKAFYGKRLFPYWERMFRRFTGLGRVPLDAGRRATAKRYGFCDVLVIGAGPSGLAAALAAAEAGARVVLVDEARRPGGAGVAPDERQRLEALLARVAAAPAISILCDTVAAGCYADRWVALAEPHRLTKMRAQAVVFATGVVEQPAVFRNNDLPGVMLASGAARLLRRFRVAPGQRVAIVAANDEAYAFGRELHGEGVRVAAIVDLRPEAEAGTDAAAFPGLGIPVLAAHAPFEAVPDAKGRVAALIAAPLSEGRVDARGGRHHRRIECDAILMSVGWAAATQLIVQAGGSTRFSDVLQQFVPDRLPEGILAAGRVNGVFELEARIADGRRAGAAAAAQAGFAAERLAEVPRSTRRPSHPFPIIDHPRGKNFVDFDEDLTVKDLENAVQEGFDSSELLKRYSTVGMGPSQGKHSGMNALRILARARGLEVPDLGLTTARPLYHPVPLKLLAGRGFHILRRTPVDAVHAAQGAVFMPAGNWRRPEFYRRADETRAESIDAEVEAVRSRVGLIDVGTLGKIEIHGPQAGAFLDRVYAGRYADMRIGTTRYGLMLDEAGVIVDDGVIARVRSDAYYFTTTTSGSAAVYRELTRLAALWGLECALVNVTGHRAAFNLAGPASRAVLERLTLDLDVGEASLPYLGVRSGTVAGCAALLMRVGFVGELGFEIHVPASGAVALWEALCAAGREHGLRPFGVEAQRILRLEKGHLIVGQDTDGLTDPFEAGASWAVSMAKPFFVGQRSLRILKARGPRQRLTGVEFPEPAPFPRESQLVIEGGDIAGRITSVARSRTLGKTIGLALVRPDLAEEGREIRVRGDGGTMLSARIVPTPFYDPEQRRQRPEAAAATRRETVEA